MSHFHGSKGVRAIDVLLRMDFFPSPIRLQFTQPFIIIVPFSQYDSNTVEKSINQFIHPYIVPKQFSGEADPYKYKSTYHTVICIEYQIRSMRKTILQPSLITVQMIWCLGDEPVYKLCPEGRPCEQDIF